MSRLFLSYAREDADRARGIAECLENSGHKVFWDRNIPVGQTWEDVLERELEGATCVVVLWSPASAKSDWVKIEADEGKEKGVLVPVVLEATKIPLRFKHLQAANLEKWTSDLEDPEFLRILTAIDALKLASRAADSESAMQFETSAAAQNMRVRQFRDLCGKFYNQPLAVRQAAAKDVEALSLDIDHGYFLQAARSSSAGDRVGAAIGLRRWLATTPELLHASIFVETIRNGLQDKRSRVRYRYLQLVADNRDELSLLKPVLEKLARNDVNKEVRKKARSLLP